MDRPTKSINTLERDGENSINFHAEIEQALLYIEYLEDAPEPIESEIGDRYRYKESSYVTVVSDEKDQFGRAKIVWDDMPGEHWCNITSMVYVKLPDVPEPIVKDGGIENPTQCHHSFGDSGFIHCSHPGRTTDACSRVQFLSTCPPSGKYLRCPTCREKDRKRKK